MKTSVHVRLDQYIKYHKIKIEPTAAKMGVNKGSIYNYKEGRNDIPLQFLEKFIKLFPTINVCWLMTGDGDMDIPSVDNIAREGQHPYGCKNCIKKDREINNLYDQIELLKTNLIDCQNKLRRQQPADEKRKAV